MSSVASAPVPSRRSLYWIFIALGLGSVLGRILAVNSVDDVKLQEWRIERELEARQKKFEQNGLRDAALQEALDDEEPRLREKLALERPFLSANDRSRWCTVRALVEPELRVPGAPYAIDRVIALRRWDTIDMVKRYGHLYSSKPPLLATLVAAIYWPLYHWAGLSLGDEPHAVGRLLLVLVNLLPLAIYFVLLARLVEQFGATDWGRLLVMAAATLGTFITTFAVVFTNHLPAAVCALATLYACVRIVGDGERRLRYFVSAGLFAALLVTNELPALVLAALVAGGLLWLAPRPTLCGFLPAALVVAAAFFATNYIAVQSFQPAYAHRTSGNDWYDYTYERNGKIIESYWRNPVGVDRGEPSKGVYAWHCLLGHHGLFSLTPIWLLSVLGCVLGLRRAAAPCWRAIVAAIGAATIVCLVFYLAWQPQLNRNYGGMSSGLRWMFWFAPLWLVMMLPAADLLARRAWSRGLGLTLLALSVLSASYPTWNPWTAPWLMTWLSYWL